jgi:hypothetical protein
MCGVTIVLAAFQNGLPGGKGFSENASTPAPSDPALIQAALQRHLVRGGAPRRANVVGKCVSSELLTGE